jgi:DNA-binding MarR family transcriptional regulator
MLMRSRRLLPIRTPMRVKDRELSHREAVDAVEREFAALSERFRHVAAAHAHRLSPELSPASYKLFRLIIAQGTVTPSRLAELTLSDKSQISRAVRELEELGLVRRELDQSDRRSTLIYATEQGLDRLAGLKQHPDGGGVMEALGDWPITELRQLSRLLHALSSGERP